jgi:hypothetical protein
MFFAIVLYFTKSQPSGHCGVRNVYQATITLSRNPNFEATVVLEMFIMQRVQQLSQLERLVVRVARCYIFKPKISI